jgi:ankyrin repeat protein
MYAQEVWTLGYTYHPVDADTIANTMRLLIDHGENVAAKDETHSTPLHMAAFWCNIEAVRVLTSTAPMSLQKMGITGRLCTLRRLE